VALTVLFAFYFWWDILGLVYASLIVIFLSSYEYAKMTFRDSSPWLLRYSFMALCLALASGTIFSPPWLWDLWALLLPLTLICALWTLKDHENESLLQTLSLFSLGVLILGLFLPLGAKVLLMPKGELCFLSLLMIVFLGDTAAYFGGKMIGGKKLMPRVSPGKTWSGSLSGLLGSLFAGYVVHLLMLKSLHLGFILPFSILVGFCGQNGDLLLSLLKRVAGLKDSGRIMPGHGGILDRIDGLVFAGPVFFVGLQWGYGLV
jgi:phosphatidate cytidylyltransferase